MAANAIEVTDANFEEVVINSDIPVVVDFWAPWCGPCVTAAPAVDEIAAELKGKLKVCKMNVDVNRNTPVKYNVRSIPNFIVFKGGALQEQFAGFSSKDQLKKTVEKYL
ncbi:MAG: thioredoxin [bacterium]|nr:thioredoxin [bacterium]